MTDPDLRPMALALEEAILSENLGEVPVGAIIFNSQSGEIIARAGNRIISESDPCAHAEILAIREACKLAGSPRVPELDLYVTLEPCPMCAAAISLARIKTVFFGAYDPKGGGVIHGARIFDQSTCNHRPKVYGGIEETACSKLLKDFFEAKR